MNGKTDILSNSYFDVVCGGIYCSVYTTYLSTNGSWNIVSNNLSTNSNPQFLIKCQYNSVGSNLYNNFNLYYKKVS